MARRYGGSGLGLSICKQLCQLMKGSISVESHLHRGSTFSFMIQLKSSEKKMRASLLSEFSFEETSLAPEAKNAVRILVAEDNPVNQEITLRMLHKAGFKADAVANGLQVLTSMQDMKYDLILMDCQMPEMDGFEATHCLRDHGYTIPIIALTANVFTKDKNKCFDAGMTDYLSKPVNYETLISTIEKTLKSLQFSPLVDFSVLKRLEILDEAGNRNLLKKLVHLYSEAMPSGIEDLRSNILKEKFDLARKKAHVLKSSSSNLGLRYLAKMLEKIEKEEIHESELINHVEKIDVEFKLASKELQKYLS